MNIRPLQDRVVVRRAEEETTTASGIVLPGNATEKPGRGEVLAVGSGKVLDNGEVRPVDVQIGDTIMFGSKAGQEIKIDNEVLLVLHEQEIIAILKETK